VNERVADRYGWWLAVSPADEASRLRACRSNLSRAALIVDQFI
jgi:hypothetical protein